MQIQETFVPVNSPEEAAVIARLNDTEAKKHIKKISELGGETNEADLYADELKGEKWKFNLAAKMIVDQSEYDINYSIQRLQKAFNSFLQFNEAQAQLFGGLREIKKLSGHLNTLIETLQNRPTVLHPKHIELNAGNWQIDSTPVKGKNLAGGTIVKMNGEFMRGVQEIKFEAGVTAHPSLTVKFIPNMTSPAKDVPKAPDELFSVETPEKPVMGEAESETLEACSGHPVTKEDEVIRQERRQKVAERRAVTQEYIGIIESLWPTNDIRPPKEVDIYIDSIEDEKERARILNALAAVAQTRLREKERKNV